MAKMTMKQFEKSATDKKLDKKNGYKEGYIGNSNGDFVALFYTFCGS